MQEAIDCIQKHNIEGETNVLEELYGFNPSRFKVRTESFFLRKVVPKNLRDPLCRQEVKVGYFDHFFCDFHRGWWYFKLFVQRHVVCYLLAINQAPKLAEARLE